MKTFKSFAEFAQAYKEEKNWKDEEMSSASKDITKYTTGDLNKFSTRKKKMYVYSKFLYMDDSDAGQQAGMIKGTDNRIDKKKQKPTALYMVVCGPMRDDLYPAGSYYVSHDRVNAVGETVMGWTGTARLVTYDIKDAIAYIKKYGGTEFQRKQIEKGQKGWNAWPTTYDLTGDFKGQPRLSNKTIIKNLEQIKYKY